VSFLSGKEVEEYKKLMSEIKLSIEDIAEITKNNK
jgi:hypothetical protein